MKELEAMFDRPPSRDVRLKFHVLDRRRESIEQVVENLVPANPPEHGNWEQTVKGVLFSVVRDVVPPREWPPVLAAEYAAFVQERLMQNARTPQEPAHETDPRGNSDAGASTGTWQRPEDFFASAKHQAGVGNSERTLRMRQAFGTLDEVVENLPPLRELVSDLFSKGRFMATASVHPGDALKLAVEGLVELSPTDLATLHSPLLQDVNFVIVSAARKAGLKGRVFYLSLDMTPQQVADTIGTVIDDFRRMRDHGTLPTQRR